MENARENELKKDPTVAVKLDSIINIFISEEKNKWNVPDINANQQNLMKDRRTWRTLV